MRKAKTKEVQGGCTTETQPKNETGLQKTQGSHNRENSGMGDGVHCIHKCCNWYPLSESKICSTDITVSEQRELLALLDAMVIAKGQ